MHPRGMELSLSLSLLFTFCLSVCLLVLCLPAYPLASLAHQCESVMAFSTECVDIFGFLPTIMRWVLSACMRCKIRASSSTSGSVRECKRKSSYTEIVVMSQQQKNHIKSTIISALCVSNLYKRILPKKNPNAPYKEALVFLYEIPVCMTALSVVLCENAFNRN